MMDNIWNSQFWYLYWLLPLVGIGTLVASQIIAKLQSSEFYRPALKHIDPEAHKKSPETRLRRDVRIGRFLSLFEAQIAEARSYRDSALEALRAAEAAKGWKAAQGAALAARAAALKTDDAAHAAAMARKNLRPNMLPESERAFALPRPKPGTFGGGNGGAPRDAKALQKYRLELDPRTIKTSATVYVAEANEAAKAAEAIAARWKQSHAAD